MPPRSSPNRGGPRGGRPSRGGHPGGGNRGSQPDHITTFGARRPGFGTGGSVVKIIINAFPTTVPDAIIHQYDVVHSGKLPARMNMDLLRSLQEEEAAIFTPKVVYDGRSIIFSIRELPLGPTNSKKVISLL
ncbi:hypothetical protein BYT27DRAFT_7111030 [Phlegmacium glaucopus]|nr:hypothetical protein BYT27DRAFT_7111030 [Phlegmacium glaucopus]